MDIKTTLANNRKSVMLKQYKLNKAKSDLKKKDPKVTSVIYYNNDKVLVGYSDGNLKKADSVLGLRAQTLTDTTIKSDGSKLSCVQINDMDRKYRRVWQYEGETYGVKPGKIERLENGVGGREITNVYDIKGWDLYDPQTKYRSDLTTIWGYSGYTNNFRIIFNLSRTHCYHNQKNILNTFFNDKNNLYEIECFYQNKYTSDNIMHYFDNINSSTSTLTNDQFVKIMSMKRPAIIVSKRYRDINKDINLELLRFEAVNIFNNKYFSRYYRGFQYLNGRAIGGWRPELHKFLLPENNIAFGAYHLEYIALQSGFIDGNSDWSYPALFNTRFNQFYRDFMSDGVFLRTIDGKSASTYHNGEISWVDISFNSGCCYELEGSSVWNSMNNDFDNIRGPLANNGGGGLTREEINFLNYEYNIKEIFDTDDFRNFYKLSILSDGYVKGPWDSEYTDYTFYSIEQNIFNKNDFVSFYTFMHNLSSTGNNNVWIDRIYNDSSAEDIKYFYHDVFNSIKYLRTVNIVYYFLRDRQSKYKYASKLMNFINITSYTPGVEFGKTISNLGVMAFGKYIFVENNW